MEKRIKDVILYLKNRFGEIQCFNTRNTVGDYMEEIYNKVDI